MKCLRTSPRFGAIWSKQRARLGPKKAVELLKAGANLLCTPIGTGPILSSSPLVCFFRLAAGEHTAPLRACLLACIPRALSSTHLVGHLWSPARLALNHVARRRVTSARREPDSRFVDGRLESRVVVPDVVEAVVDAAHNRPGIPRPPKSTRGRGLSLTVTRREEDNGLPVVHHDLVTHPERRRRRAAAQRRAERRRGRDVRRGRTRRRRLRRVSG